MTTSRTTSVDDEDVDEDDGWMLHKHINVNGRVNTDESSTKRRFFGDEEEDFPNIESMKSEADSNSLSRIGVGHQMMMASDVSDSSSMIVTDNKKQFFV